jgi:hypothetical protein
MSDTMRGMVFSGGPHDGIVVNMPNDVPVEVPATGFLCRMDGDDETYQFHGQMDDNMRVVVVYSPEYNEDEDEA